MLGSAESEQTMPTNRDNMFEKFQIM